MLIFISRRHDAKHARRCLISEDRLITVERSVQRMLGSRALSCIGTVLQHFGTGLRVNRSRLEVDIKAVENTWSANTYAAF